MDLFGLTRKLIELDSTTGREAMVVDFLRDYLETAGFSVLLQPLDRGRANIYAHTGEPEIVFSTHTDTVVPHVACRHDEDFIYGRGACDAKGILAAQIKAVEQLRSQGIHETALLFVAGEESGSDGARAANTIANRCRFLIDGEPTENKLALGSKGALRLELKTAGRAAHAAYPEHGESAILKLLDLLQEMRTLALPVDPVLGHATCNIGTIGGGVQANVVPDSARAEVMFRTVGDPAQLKERIAEIVRQRAELRYTFDCAPVFLQGVEGFETTVVAFTTDIPLLDHWGKPLLLGPGSILDAHRPEERISKRELVRGVELYCRLARALLQSGI